MTNKDKYVKSIDKLKVDEYLKQKVMKQIEASPRKAPYLKLANAMLIVILVISCTIIMQEKVGDNTIYMIQDTTKNIAKADSKIKNVESIEQLKALIEPVQNSTLATDSYFEAIKDLSTYNTVAEKTQRTEEIDYSETNVQVKGVDEADIVKTDGKYIYYSGIDNTIMIVKANEQLKKVSEIKVDEEQEKNYGGMQELYLTGNKLIAISQKSAYVTVCYDSIGGSSAKTTINVYNIEDKENITKERKIELEGNYVSSRLIGTEIYVVTNHYINSEEIQPIYTDTVIGEESKCVSLQDIYYIEDERSRQYLNVAAFKVDENKEVSIQSFLGMGQEIYVNESNMYITSVKYDREEVPTDTNTAIMRVNLANPKTRIFKFKLSNANVEFKEYAEVEGRIINQFALDETGGYFRIATTSTKNNKISNNLFVLNARLEKVGEITGIAEGENMYAVRFIKDKAYMVTYEQIDPLFVIDLSDARNPKVLGELKIPGFSNYLHPYDENHLIGIGQETEVQKNGNVKTIGLKVSLFDISNSAEPKEVSKLVIEASNVYSTALYNHKAFLFIKENNTLVFPITISTGGKKAVYGTEVIKITPKEGIVELGRIVTDENGKDWKKQVDRIVRINDNIYNICRSGIIANNLETLQETNRVDF